MACKISAVRCLSQRSKTGEENNNHKKKKKKKKFTHTYKTNKNHHRLNNQELPILETLHVCSDDIQTHTLFLKKNQDIWEVY